MMPAGSKRPQAIAAEGEHSDTVKVRKVATWNEKLDRRCPLAVKYMTDHLPQGLTMQTMAAKHVKDALVEKLGYERTAVSHDSLESSMKKCVDNRVAAAEYGRRLQEALLQQEQQAEAQTTDQQDTEAAASSGAPPPDTSAQPNQTDGAAAANSQVPITRWVTLSRSFCPCSLHTRADCGLR